MDNPVTSPPALADIPAVFKQAQSLQAQGQVDQALALYLAILVTKPDVPEAHFQAARLFQQDQDFNKASLHYTQAIKLRPNEPAIWQAISGFLSQTRDPNFARTIWPILQQASVPAAVKQSVSRIVERAKSTSKAAAKLIEFRLRGDLYGLIERGSKAVKAHPKDLDVTLELAMAHAQLKTNQDALKLFQKAARLAPKAIFPKLQQAVMLQRLGDMTAAEAILNKILNQDPTWGETYWLIAVGRKFDHSDPLISQMKQQFKVAQNGASKMFLGLALGKAMQDTGAHAEVFGYLNAANGEGRKMYPYDVNQRITEVAAIKRSCRNQPFSNASSVPKATAPIFVTGMPRSGTTLVEQIIAAHPEAKAGGETGLPLEAVYNSLWTGSEFQEWSALQASDLHQIADRFETGLRARLDFDRVITDKSIQSHLIIGPLLQTIPNAKVVVVHRDPRDIALSCYKNFFPAGTHRYSNSLPDLARYIQTFQDIVSFWRETLPKGAFHEISYDDLIEDQEGQSRALIAACGLDWDDNCLNFHNNAGAVSTLSVAQVRKPIYKSSSRGWERYKADLKPFTDILGG